MNKKINNVFNMMRRALNTLDYQLMDHGERVAYMLLCMYEDEDVSNEELVKICHMGMLHDIGAYQTEMLDSLINSSDTFNFEVANTLSHSVYSYLFLNKHQFFSQMADAVLFHHFPYNKLLQTDCKNIKLAARIFIADRLDIMIIKGYAKTSDDLIKFLQNPVFSKEDAQKIIRLEKEKNVLTDLLKGNYVEKVLSFLNSSDIHENEMRELLLMLPNAIDFRSEHTVTHTAATVEISVLLSKFLGFSEHEVESVELGAMLHDIGKISVSPMILEKTSSLTDNEFKIMKDHVLLSEHILRGCVSDEVLQIAVRHHEKLDKTGYPKGLGADDLSMPEKIVAVADILSALMGKRSYKAPFSKEKVVGIISDMAQGNKICKKVTMCAIENYDILAQKTDSISDEMEIKYKDFRKCAQYLYDKYS